MVYQRASRSIDLTRSEGRGGASRSFERGEDELVAPDTDAQIIPGRGTRSIDLSRVDQNALMAAAARGSGSMERPRARASVEEGSGGEFVLDPNKRTSFGLVVDASAVRPPRRLRPDHPHPDHPALLRWNAGGAKQGNG